MKITAIIPARYNSTRFPGKPLKEIAGKSMIEHVYSRVSKAKSLEQVIVATDDLRIYEEVEDFGGKVVMTDSDHRSGTDRIAEVAAGLDSDLIINVQGDEPLLKPEMIEEAVEPFFHDDKLKMSTLKTEIDSPEEMLSPNVVKVVTDLAGYALYFSRSPLPYLKQGNICSYKHIGLYVYNRDFLLEFSRLAPTPLEKAESLEQLRALENGYRIKVVETDYMSIGVDTPEDVAEVARIIAAETRECVK